MKSLEMSTFNQFYLFSWTSFMFSINRKQVWMCPFSTYQQEQIIDSNMNMTAYCFTQVIRWINFVKWFHLTDWSGTALVNKIDYTSHWPIHRCVCNWFVVFVLCGCLEPYSNFVRKESGLWSIVAPLQCIESRKVKNKAKHVCR